MTGKIRTIRVGHALGPLGTASGGIRTYLRNLGGCETDGVSHRLIDLAEGSPPDIDVLHLHERTTLLEMALPDLPMVCSLHNHSPYCPSGTKYLAARGIPCDRQMSVAGCLWGQLAEGCGSRRPERILESLKGAYRERARLLDSSMPVLANSDYVRGQLLRHGLSPAQVTTLRFGLPRPADPEPLELAIHRQRTLLFAGRIVPDKGLDWLLRALAISDSGIFLEVAGDGWDRPRMEKLSQKLGLEKRVRWHGWCKKEQLDSLYRQCFALVFPSLWHEPAGLVTLEAYAHARPVIASAVGGIPEHLRDGETGILVAPNDIRALAAAIGRLRADYALARRLGEQGYAWLRECFTIEAHVHRLAQIYRQTIAEFYNR